MKIDFNPQQNEYELVFKLRSSKINDLITGIESFLNETKKGSRITLEYKKKTKKNKTFYRIKIKGKEKPLIEVIKVLDSTVQQKTINWNEIIKKIKAYRYEDSKELSGGDSGS